MSLPLHYVCRPLFRRAVHPASRVNRPSLPSIRLNSSHLNIVAMSSPQTRRPSSSSSSSSSSASSTAKRQVPEARPSSSIVLLSPANEVLLLHRVQTSKSFASAHVFPGGNLDAFHDGDIPTPSSPERHQDGPAYRLGAIRECFEETGILLAKRDGQLVDLPQQERDEARKRIHSSQIKFGDYLSSIGAVADTDGLIPCTRWITPVGPPKRFTTQMYIYLLPISRSSVPSEMLVPTPDNGVEHTAAVFAPPQAFLSRAASSDIIVFPPQCFLLDLVARFLTSSNASPEGGSRHLISQRENLLSFLKTIPTADTDKGKEHPTAKIPWADKVMSPYHLLVRESDKRIVLGLDKPGPELKGSERGGDWDRVVLVNFGKAGSTNVEVRRREDVFNEENASVSEGSKL